MVVKFFARILGFFDRLFLVSLLDFETYFNLHKKLGFPIKKLYFFYIQKYRLNLNNPVTFNEKIIYRQLFEKNPLLLKIVDKYAVREYVKEKIGEKHLIPLLQVSDSFDDIDFSKLPNDYIMKMTHASGRNIIVKNGKNSYNYDRKELKRTIDNWFTEKYQFQKLVWFVQQIKRKIVIEELLCDDGKIPKDYKFFVFDGKVEMIQVDQDRFTEHTRNLYDVKWNRMDCKITHEQGLLDKRPDTLEQMIDLGERLAYDFTFMRVDFYCIGSKIYFGELTPCPGGGLESFLPETYDEYFGKKWKNHASLIRK